MKATIRQQRPELLAEYSECKNLIPKDPPLGFFTVPSVPDVGELMLASFIPCSGFSLVEWWMGEKFDGMRACWNPSTINLYSRTGNPLGLRPDYVLFLPHSFCDGEIWLGRRTFKDVVPLFTNKLRNSAWSTLRYMIFDDPSPNLRKQRVCFEQRFQSVLHATFVNHPFAISATRLRVISKDHVDKYTEVIINDAGEGIMLRKPGSAYENGRSHYILKYKTIRDGDALILAVNGIYCTCQLPNGKVFTAKRHSQDPLNIGHVVSFKCISVTSLGIPRQAVVLRRRDDIKWDYILQAALHDRWHSVDSSLSKVGGQTK